MVVGTSHTESTDNAGTEGILPPDCLGECLQSGGEYGPGLHDGASNRPLYPEDLVNLVHCRIVLCETNTAEVQGTLPLCHLADHNLWYSKRCDQMLCKIYRPAKVQK